MKDKNKKYNMTFDNLAIPEVYTGEKTAEDAGSGTEGDSSAAGDEAITYDTVAIPEIHIKK